MSRRQTLVLLVLFLGGVLIPFAALPIVGLSRPGILAKPSAIDITFLVINCLQLAMQIIQFVFIVHQIFVWRDQSPPHENEDS